MGNAFQIFIFKIIVLPKIKNRFKNIKLEILSKVLLLETRSIDSSSLSYVETIFPTFPFDLRSQERICRGSIWKVSPLSKFIESDKFLLSIKYFHQIPIPVGVRWARMESSFDRIAVSLQRLQHAPTISR